MEEKWIGEKDDTSGSYFKTSCSELKKRSGGYHDAKKLYQFNSRFGETYYITDEGVIDHIEEELLLEENHNLYEYLYNLVIQEFGVIEFIVRIGHKISEQRSEGYSVGKSQAQKDIRVALGL